MLSKVSVCDYSLLMLSILRCGIADAEECWGALTHALKEVKGLPSEGSPEANKDVIEQYMMGIMRRE